MYGVICIFRIVLFVSDMTVCLSEWSGIVVLCHFLLWELSIIPTEFLGSFCRYCRIVISLDGMSGIVMGMRLGIEVSFYVRISVWGNDGGTERELWRVWGSFPSSPGNWILLADSCRDRKNSYFSVLGHPSMYLAPVHRRYENNRIVGLCSFVDIHDYLMT